MSAPHPLLHYKFRNEGTRKIVFSVYPTADRIPLLHYKFRNEGIRKSVSVYPIIDWIPLLHYEYRNEGIRESFVVFCCCICCCICCRIAVFLCFTDDLLLLQISKVVVANFQICCCICCCICCGNEEKWCRLHRVDYADITHGSGHMSRGRMKTKPLHSDNVAPSDGDYADLQHHVAIYSDDVAKTVCKCYGMWRTRCILKQFVHIVWVCFFLMRLVQPRSWVTYIYIYIYI